MNIFTYEGLKNKAYREFERLIDSQAKLDHQSAIDHALNAAFTVYHLIQWRENLLNPNEKIKVHNFIMNTNNRGLKVLHNLVTCNKHVTVTVKAYPGETNPHIEKDICFITTEDGKRLVTEDDYPLVTEASRIDVCFGELLAIDVLKDAMKEFT